MSLDRMLERLSQAPAKDVSRQRQISVWKGEPVDRLPILFGVPTPGLEGGIHFDMKECYEDREKMLFETLYSMISQAESPSDSLPGIRANTGTGTLPCCFGLKQEIFPDKMPWLKEHLTKEQIMHLEPDDFDDVTGKGIMPQVLDYQRYFKSQLNGSGWVFLSDTQGPMDIAHLVRGDDIFFDMYDDPPFVHHLMELALAVYISATKAMKANLDEPYDQGPHVDGVFVANGAVRVCEDTPVILSPHLIERFVVPYTKRAL
ncbi:MAG TPA: uroporphyrinogen decarboxylase family protein, partial [bacterium]|nr:uroporphyrinogen decarboxylase family protein [bacterium]